MGAPRLSAAEIIAAYRRGATGPEIARAHGCSAATIYNRLRAAGIPRRPASRRTPWDWIAIAKRETGRGAIDFASGARLTTLGGC